MKILVYMGHPAHFYLYKNTIKQLREDEHQVEILIKKKDILQTLLDNQGWEYHNILQEGRKNSKLGMLIGMLKRAWRQNKFCAQYKPDILTGTSVENSYIGKLRHIPVINCNEDDAAVVPLYAKLSYPWADAILNPIVCNSGKWDSKATKYPSYQELAYLHPNHFTADAKVVKGYGIDVTKPYFVMRFASLHAHHDNGIKGINTEIAERLVKILEPHGTIYITSERPLEPQFEKYRIKINPLDMHHVMAFASLYIGDSQTMAAEAGVLGVPFVRFNDFVGRIGYLRELEDVYKLGYGIHATPLNTDSPIRRNDGSVQPSGVEELYKRVEQLVAMPSDERRATFQSRRQKMLSEKIDCAKFLTYFIENYPKSVEETKKADKEFWDRFR
jgi:hypothetical protein